MSEADVSVEQSPRSRQIYTFMLRSLRELFRSKIALFWAIGWPTFWYGLTMSLFISEQPPEIMSVIKATNAITFGMFGAFTVSLVTFSQNFSGDLEEKRYRKLRSLPISPWADLTGRFLAAFVMASVSFASVLIVGLIDNASFQIHGWYSIPIVAVSLFLFCVVGMTFAVLIASFVPNGEYVTAITTTLLMILFFVTGYNGIQPMVVPEGSRQIVNFLPNSLATRMQVFHLTELGGLDSIRDSGLVPPELPSAPKYMLLLGVSAAALWVVSMGIMRLRIYDGEAGE